MAAVSAGLVLQRGASRNFPRMGFVMMASTSGVPPGTLMEGGYDPTTYAHDDPVGPRRRFLYESQVDGIRPNTDWKVITIGIDTNVSSTDPQSVQVPLGRVLIGLRCHEISWEWPFYPGCRVSLTATLLPFVMSNNLTVVSPMARGDTHVYQVTVGDYDTLNVSLTRDVANRTHEPARGLIGAAMIQRESWVRPEPLDIPFNVSRSPPGTDLEVWPGETSSSRKQASAHKSSLSLIFISRSDTQPLPSLSSFLQPRRKAMQSWIYNQLRTDKGLINLEGCALGDGGCRRQVLPSRHRCGTGPRGREAVQDT